ncbi:MAG: hypothetical protein F6K56_36270 [Moorea sp. SIO3G5]|nr:hypothetical protein [Moorena sp. SIO3G5]
MNPRRTNILARFGKQTTLALTVVSLTFGITSNVQAQSFRCDFQLNQNFSGLFGNTNSSKRFFGEGRHQFETEIKNLLNNQRYSTNPPVEISDEVINLEGVHVKVAKPMNYVLSEQAKTPEGGRLLVQMLYINHMVPLEDLLVLENPEQLPDDGESVE